MLRFDVQCDLNSDKKLLIMRAIHVDIYVVLHVSGIPKKKSLR